MLRSSCLCGAVTWEVNGELQFMSHCHCSRCRKTRGSAFATDVAAPADGYMMRGREHVAGFASSPELTRCFCAVCGSTVPGEPWQGLVFVPAGNFVDDPGVRPLAHIFVASKAPWYEIRDQLPRFDAYPPGVEATVLSDLPRPHSSARPRGSCLCGSVSFELTSTPVLAHNCHCGRCRRKSSAAHSSSLATPIDGARFLCGEDLLVTYKLPEATFFAHAFCRVCGGKLPRLDSERGIAMVPMGALDDDPGIRPAAHIYVASKAPWFEIHDNLPQFAEHYQRA
ncbi:MAG TPA: GFA family protein [Burkholderiales bacterium]|nr:GFA family protein [Burkholderiales bacterium]